MSGIVVESLGAGGTMHIVHSSAQMGCFLLFALVFLHGSKLSTADNIAIKISAPTAYSPII